MATSNSSLPIVLSEIRAWVFYLLVLLTVGCTKETVIDPNADLAIKIAGDYAVTDLKVDKIAYDLVKQGIVAKINIVKKDNANVTMGLTTTFNRQTTTDDLGTIELKETTKNTITLYQNNATVGTIIANVLTLDITDGGTNYVLKASK